jgi:tRNA(adenine34) deaminase
MRRALELAEQAGRISEIPVGAVAVRGGEIVGEGFNRRETDRNPLAHAELVALREAARTLGGWRLSGVTLYVTLEPCAMCAGAMVQSRIDRLVYGAADPKAGAAGSLYNLLTDERLNHRVAITASVLPEDCAKVMVDFFKGLRAERGHN